MRSVQQLGKTTAVVAGLVGSVAMIPVVRGASNPQILSVAEANPFESACSIGTAQPDLEQPGAAAGGARLRSTGESVRRHHHVGILERHQQNEDRAG